MSNERLQALRRYKSEIEIVLSSENHPKFDRWVMENRHARCTEHILTILEERRSEWTS